MNKQHPKYVGASTIDTLSAEAFTAAFPVTVEGLAVRFWLLAGDKFTISDRGLEYVPHWHCPCYDHLRSWEAPHKHGLYAPCRFPVRTDYDNPDKAKDAARAAQKLARAAAALTVEVEHKILTAMDPTPEGAARAAAHREAGFRLLAKSGLTAKILKAAAAGLSLDQAEAYLAALPANNAGLAVRFAMREHDRYRADKYGYWENYYPAGKTWQPAGVGIITLEQAAHDIRRTEGDLLARAGISAVRVGRHRAEGDDLRAYYESFTRDDLALPAGEYGGYVRPEVYAAITALAILQDRTDVRVSTAA